MILLFKTFTMAALVLASFFLFLLIYSFFLKKKKLKLMRQIANQKQINS